MSGVFIPHFMLSKSILIDYSLLSVAAYDFLSLFNKYFDASVIEISEFKKFVQLSPNSMPLLNDTPCKLFHSERNR